MTVDIAKIQVDLAHHIKRTEIAEARIARLDDALRPVQSHVQRWAGALQLLVVLGMIVAVLSGLLRLFNVI